MCVDNGLKYFVLGNVFQNLTRWGGALLELAHFRQGQDSIDMVQGFSLDLGIVCREFGIEVLACVLRP